MIIRRVYARETQLINDLATNMRDGDLAEVVASGRSDVFSGVFLSVKQSIAYAVIDDDKVLAMFGVVPVRFEQGHMIWLLGTHRLERYKKRFVRQSKDILEEWQRDYGVLYNFVHEDNRQTVRWLKWLGASFGEPYETQTGARFMLFTLGGDNSV